MSAAKGGPGRASLPAASLPPSTCAIVGRMDDTSTTSELAIVIGSVREGRFGPVAASWVAGQAAAHGGFDVKVVDLADYEITSPCRPRHPSTPATPTRVRPA
jgi:NAD(P)H-dependent FMN reductase